MCSFLFVFLLLGRNFTLSKDNALVAIAQKTPVDEWSMQDETPWQGNNPRDHPGMIQVNYQFTFSDVIICYF